MPFVIAAARPVRSAAFALALASCPALAQRAACPAVADVDSVLVAGRVTLFGEMHGTQQSPAFVANVLCQAAARRIRTTLGVELPVESAPITDRYIHSNGDSAMAETLAAAIANDRSGVFIVLTGNIHSQIVIGTAANGAYRPMGYLLRSIVAPRRVLGLNVTYDSGTAWICTGASPDTCGARALRGRAVVGPDSIRLGAADRAYDGRYGVGALVASPPASRDGARIRGSSDALAANVVDRVVRALCDKRVALLGESPTHGFGKTMQLKAEIVQRLVDDCHYTAVFFESGAYDFLEIERTLKAGGTVTQPMVAAAIGGLWANRDVAPLIPFLADRVQRGALVLGGLDDQLGRGTYAQKQMPGDLVQVLGDDDRTRCLGILQRHLLWQYTSEAPYGAKDQAAILGCLDAIETKLGATKRGAEYDLAIIDNFRRTMRRDYDPAPPNGVDRDVELFNERDASMYKNFVWLTSRLPASAKIVVWTANNHAAKDLSSIPGQDRRVSLGSHIHRQFKAEVFALAVSAYGGSYARGSQPVRALEPAPDSTLEARAFAKTDTSASYLDAARLRALGRIAARPVGSAFTTANWSDVFDGLVIIHDERPPRGF